MSRDLRATPTLVVPDIRDYSRINAELSLLLDAGHPLVRLAGVAGQRLLVSGLRGGWNALVVVEGDAGPELAAGLDAPNLSVVCTGSARDGAGRGIRNGRLLISGDADAAVGYAQAGGTILVTGTAGPRAGLDQSGGWLVLMGATGRLAGERQRGGRIVVVSGSPGPFWGRGRTGGESILGPDLDDRTHRVLEESARALGTFWPSTLPGATRVG